VKRRLAAGLLLAACIAGFYWSLLANRTTWLSGDDITYQVLPWLQFQATEWHAGRVPLWDPYHWFGQPLIGQGQPGVASPVNWLLFAMPLQDGHIGIAVLHAWFVLIHFLAAWAMYKLAREFGCHRLAAIGGGLVFSLAGFMGRCMWPQILLGAVWIPLALMYAWRVRLGRRPLASAILGGFFLGLCWLSGHHQVPLFASIALAGLWIWMWTRDRRLWRAGLLFWAIAGMAGALQILPMQEYGRLAVRWAGAPDVSHWNDVLPYGVHRAFSLHPASILGLILPDKSTHPDPYLGATACALAALGLTLAWRRAEARFAATLLCAGLLFAMAPYGLIEGLLYGLLPHLDKARNPSMALALAGLGGALLAAFGLDAILRGERGARLRPVALAVALFGLLLAGFTRFSDARTLRVALCALASAAVLALPSRLTAPGLVALILLDLSNVISAYPAAPRDDLQRHSDIAAFLRRQPGAYRVEIDLSDIPYNFGDWHGIQESLGYHPSVTENVFRQQFWTADSHRLLGVAYAIRRAPDAFYRQELFSSPLGFKVYFNPGVLSRSFLSPSIRDSVVTIERYLPNRVNLSATLAEAGTVVLSDTFYPGWQATVDGRRVEIQPTYGFLRGVAVPVGRHAIEFVYRPWSVICGAILTALAALAAAGARLIR
jgi:hypothetical protein